VASSGDGVLAISGSIVLSIAATLSLRFVQGQGEGPPARTLTYFVGVYTWKRM